MSIRSDQNEQTKMASGSPWDAASTTQKNALGKKICFADGREFVYVSSIISVVGGEALGAAVPIAIAVNKMTAAAIGATEVTVTDANMSAVTLDQFKDGYLSTTDDAGQGYTYRIKSNTAAASNVVVFTLYTPLIVAVTTATDGTAQACLHKLTVEGIAATKIVGIAAVAAAGTSEYFFWAQTKGPGVVQVTNATSLDIGIALMAGATGGVVVADGTQETIAICLTDDEDAAGFQPANLCIS